MSESESDSIISRLQSYGPCDVADALLRLGKNSGGFIPDITLQTSDSPVGSTKIIGRAFTVRWERYTTRSKQQNKNYKGHYIDLVPPQTILFSLEPQDGNTTGLSQAILGGLMATRLSKLNVSGAIIYGRIRDLSELRSTGLPVFARGLGTCASNEVAYPAEVDVPLTIRTRYGEDVRVNPGDVLMGDEGGIVAIPREVEEEVMNLLPKLREQDARVREAIENGTPAGDALKLRTL